MKSGRRMRTARKMRRIYLYTVLAWLLGIIVFWVISAMNSLSSVEVAELAGINPDNAVQHVIYFVLLVFGLLAVLLIEFLIFGRSKSGRRPSSANRDDAPMHIPDNPPRSINSRNRKPSGRHKRIIIEPGLGSDSSAETSFKSSIDPRPEE